jgi:multicomponent Na+:H+ antiporter subunit E
VSTGPARIRGAAGEHRIGGLSSRGDTVVHSISAVASLFVFWLLLSGHYTPFLVAAGLGSAVAVMALARRMDVVDHEGHPAHLAPRALLGYWPWLIREILKSGWAVTRIVLDPRLPISPTLVRFRPTQKTDVGLTTHANSITLTPGTISVEVGRDEFLVHAVAEEGAEGILGGDMDRRVTRFEGRE